MPASSSPPSGPLLFSGARKNWKFVLQFVVLSLLFWLLEFAYQYYSASRGSLASSLVRASALAGSTFFAFALLSSALFRWRPAWAKYGHVRRSFGVMGFAFIALHIYGVIFLVAGGNISIFYSILNPFVNPTLFGSLALPVFFLLAITSSDYALAKLGPGRWKTLHRTVYFGYLSSIFHFLLINPSALQNLAGYLMLFLTFLALGGEMACFIQTARKKNFQSVGTALGALVIALYLLIGYLAYFAPEVVRK